jgi:hypothetical protein
MEGYDNFYNRLAGYITKVNNQLKRYILTALIKSKNSLCPVFIPWLNRTHSLLLQVYSLVSKLGRWRIILALNQ